MAGGDAEALDRRRQPLVDLRLPAETARPREATIHDPAPRLRAVDPWSIARALAALGALVRNHVVAIEREPGAPDPTAMTAPTDTTHGTSRSAVIATPGMADEGALQSVVRGPADHVAPVTSPRQAARVRARLAAERLRPEHHARLCAPAGLDIGACRAEAIAWSVLAELVALRAGGAGAEFRPFSVVASPPAPSTAIDPVCGAAVEAGSARLTHDRAEGSLYLCCPGRRRAFQQDPPPIGAAIA